MRKNLEARKLVLGNLLMQSKTAAEEIRNQREQLSLGIRSLLAAGKVLSVARNRLQVIIYQLQFGMCYFLKVVLLLKWNVFVIVCLYILSNSFG